MINPSEGGQNLPKVKIIGRAGSATACKIRDYLQRCDVPFDWIEVKNDEQAHSRPAGLSAAVCAELLKA